MQNFIHKTACLTVPSTTNYLHCRTWRAWWRCLTPTARWRPTLRPSTTFTSSRSVPTTELSCKWSKHSATGNVELKYFSTVSSRNWFVFKSINRHDIWQLSNPVFGLARYPVSGQKCDRVSGQGTNIVVIFMFLRN